MACIYYVYCELNVFTVSRRKEYTVQNEILIPNTGLTTGVYKKKEKNGAANGQFLGADFKIANKLLLNLVFWFFFLLWIIFVIISVSVQPVVNGHAAVLMPDFPIQGLAGPRAVIHRSTDRAAPELVLSRLGAPATGVRAEPQSGARSPQFEPLDHELGSRMRFRRRDIASEVAQERAGSERQGR